MAQLGPVKVGRNQRQVVVAVDHVAFEEEVRQGVGLTQAPAGGKTPVQPRLNALMHGLVSVEGRCRNAQCRIDHIVQQLVLQLGAIDRDVP